MQEAVAVAAAAAVAAVAAAAACAAGAAAAAAAADLQVRTGAPSAALVPLQWLWCLILRQVPGWLRQWAMHSGLQADCRSTAARWSDWMQKVPSSSRRTCSVHFELVGLDV